MKKGVAPLPLSQVFQSKEAILSLRNELPWHHCSVTLTATETKATDSTQQKHWSVSNLPIIIFSSETLLIYYQILNIYLLQNWQV